MTTRVATVLALALAVATAPAAAQSTSALIGRRLVYTFTYGTTTTIETHTSGIGMNGNPTGMNSSGAASGMASNTGGTQDQGTIAVDVVRAQPDGGLVLTVAEHARGTRSAEPATCVVFANTTTVCDPNAKVNDEELTLLRLLGANFVDPAQFDAKRHWHIALPGDPSVSADYTVNTIDGTALTIGETRVLKGSDNREIDIDSTIGYDLARQIPTAVRSYAIERSANGSQYTTNKTETVLTLQSDAPAASPAPNRR